MAMEEIKPQEATEWWQALQHNMPPDYIRANAAALADLGLKVLIRRRAYRSNSVFHGYSEDHVTNK